MYLEKKLFLQKHRIQLLYEKPFWPVNSGMTLAIVKHSNVSTDSYLTETKYFEKIRQPIILTKNTSISNSSETHRTKPFAKMHPQSTLYYCLQLFHSPTQLIYPTTVLDVPPVFLSVIVPISLLPTRLLSMAGN